MSKIIPIPLPLTTLSNLDNGFDHWKWKPLKTYFLDREWFSWGKEILSVSWRELLYDSKKYPLLSV